MPTIAIVDGALILLYFNDHAPPHFRAQGAELTMARSLMPMVEYRQAIAVAFVNGRWSIGPT